MKCPECDQALAPRTRYCPRCGKQVQKLLEPRTSAPSPPTLDEVVWHGHFSKLAMLGTWVLATVCTVLLIAFASFAQISDQVKLAIVGACVLGWLVLLARYFYFRFSDRYALTSQYLTHHSGLLWRETNRIELIDIDDVVYNQGPIERVFGVGSVRILSSDETHPDLELPGLENVQVVAEKIDEMRRAERHRRGVYIESV